MKRLFLTALCVVLGMSAQQAFAETQYSRIGHGRLLTNDLLGDGKDRWRTGSYALSFAFSKRDEGDAPQAKAFGDVIELRAVSNSLRPLI